MRKYNSLIISAVIFILNLTIVIETFADRDRHRHRHQHNRSGITINLGGTGVNFGNRQFERTRCYKYFVYDVWGNRRLIKECEPRKYYRSW
jgi:hypothetical protein